MKVAVRISFVTSSRQFSLTEPGVGLPAMKILSSFIAGGSVGSIGSGSTSGVVAGISLKLDVVGNSVSEEGNESNL